MDKKIETNLYALSKLSAQSRAGYVKNYLLGETFVNVRWPNIRFRLCGRLPTPPGDPKRLPQWEVEWPSGRLGVVPEDSAIALYRLMDGSEQEA